MLSTRPPLLTSPPATQMVPLTSAAATCWRAVGASRTTCHRPALATGAAAVAGAAPAVTVRVGLLVAAEREQRDAEARGGACRGDGRPGAPRRRGPAERAAEWRACPPGAGISGLSWCSGTSSAGLISWRPRNSAIEATVSVAGRRRLRRAARRGRRSRWGRRP